jgi:putative tricarboxylic transport membrane protein
MLEGLLEGIISVLSWPEIIFLILGTFIGLIFGAIPGIGGLTAIVLLLPTTYGMDSGLAFILIGAIQGATAFGGSIPAILLNTPGTSENTATCLDGYSMAQQGRGKEALGAAATASALGAVFGVFVLLFLIPFVKKIVLSFGPPEFFLMSLLGLTAISMVATGNMIRGLIAGGLGLLVSFVGWDPISGNVRCTFGIMYLWDGIKQIPAIIGLFAIGESLHLAIKGGTILEDKALAAKGSLFEGIIAVFRRWNLFLRCSVIGVIIGIIPGVGGAVANFLAYTHAVQTAKRPEEFGNGIIDGVIAPEAANDAKDGGMLLPTVAFGIPGSAVGVVILTAFIMHGMQPGPEMLTKHLPIVFLLIISMAFAGVLASVIGILSTPLMIKIVYIRASVLAPLVFIIAMIGAYSTTNHIGDIIVATVFGILGYFMRKFDFPRISVALGLILGRIAEVGFRQSLMISDLGIKIFFVRWVSLFILLLIVLSLLHPFIRLLNFKKK